MVTRVQPTTSGWEEAADVLVKEAHEDLHQTPRQASAQHSPYAARRAHGGGGRHKGEGGSHDDGKPGPHLIAASQPQGIELNEGGEAGDEHGALNHGHRVRAGESADPGDDEDGGQVRREHGQDVLEAQRDRRGEAGTAIQLIDHLLVLFTGIFSISVHAVFLP